LPFLLKVFFRGSAGYWETRYAKGGTSGKGSYKQYAQFKSQVINSFVADNAVTSVIEYGCGDGNQLTLCKYPKYLGFDVSPTAINRCKEIFRGDTTKSFKLTGEYANETAELTLSLDVIYHLVEDNVFENYLRRLFDSSEKFVIIYSSDCGENPLVQKPHVRHRKFTGWIEKNLPAWKLIKHIPNACESSGPLSVDFFIYRANI